jgi:hypothetical protein
MPKKKNIIPQNRDVLVSLVVAPSLRDGLHQLVLFWKADGKRARKPRTMKGLVEAAISALAAQEPSSLSFVPSPIQSVLISARVGKVTHARAAKASKRANVQLSAFVRTAMTAYLQDHSQELAKECARK